MADAKKPRIRKAETVRERTEKNAKQAEKAPKALKRTRVRKAAKRAVSPLSFLLWPFRLRPIRFVLRVLGRILVPRYFRNSFKELRQVTWPSRKETWKLTFAVLVFAVAFGTFITVLDIIFDKVIRRIVIR